jgi:RNA polymerase sigma factor for flagellar operon FliA
MVVGHILGDLDEAKPADALSEEDAAWQHYAHTRDPALRLQLIDTYLPFARMIAAKLYARRQGLEAPFEDYLHNAVLALIQSIDRFDPALGARFKTFAQYRIEGHIFNELPNMSEQHAQVGLINRLRKERIDSLSGNRVRNKKSKDKESLFEEMTELAVGLGIAYMLEGSNMYCDDEQTDDHDGYQIHAVRELRELLKKLVELLPEKEKAVIKFHYFFDLGMEEIGRELKLTKGRISQLHKQALKRLHEMAETVGLNLNI